MVDTYPINTWQCWLARAHPRGWAVRTMRLTFQMRQWAEVTLAAEGSRRQDGQAGTGWWSRRWRGLRVQRAPHDGCGVAHLHLHSTWNLSIYLSSTWDGKHHPVLPRAIRNITDANAVELGFHSRGSFPLEKLEMKAFGVGKPNLGLLEEVGHRLTARRTIRSAVNSEFVRRHLSP